MNYIRTILRTAVRFFIIWIVSATALIVTDFFLAGITINSIDTVPSWAVALAAALVLGLVNVLIRPLILLLAMPLGFIFLFIVGLFVNAVTLRLTALLFPAGLEVNSWFSAFLGGILLAVSVSIISSILGVEDPGAFYEGFIERNLTRQRPDLAKGAPTNGLVMLEIDGLSYHHIHAAIDGGYMPNLAKMIRKDGYVLSRVDCGLPSQTSSCQAGILFGDNYDIPAFRWYDKAQGRMFVSGNDAAEINARYAKGQGLLRGGASINNMVNGDADLSLLTASDLRGGTEEQSRARARDVYLLLLNPNFFMRVIGLFIGESLLEVWQYIGDVARGVRPRLNRLSHFYPFVRAATTVFMREVSGFLTIMQIVRGEPALYTTWPGYDEVAHHSGPWSRHAFGALRGYDRFIGSVRHIIDSKASRPYELIVLSDHGQSFGATFKMRYGYPLLDFIKQYMPEGAVMVQMSGGDDGFQSVLSTAAELGNISEQGVGGRTGQAATRQFQRAIERGAREAGQAADGELETMEPADVTFCGSGNLGQVYFHEFGHRATLSELNAAFPGMVEALIAHEGVGIVVALDDDGVPIVFGKEGARNLHTGRVSGRDPLLPYGDPELRDWQVRRVADFPSAGDLILLSTVYPDGTVAAFEELIGNHGGLGGEQTDAFILHPADMEIPATRNAVDLFPLLDARRERPAAPDWNGHDDDPRDDWTPDNLWSGIREVEEWLGLALNSLILDRSAYRAIATRDLMTGPAILLSLIGIWVSVLMESAPAGAAGIFGRFLGRYGLWLLTVAVMHGAAHFLRGKGNFTKTFRVMGFAAAVYVFELLRVYPPIGPLVLVLVNLLSAIISWMAVSEAHQLRGWRTLLLPVVYAAVLIVGGTVLLTIFGGVSDALMTLLEQFRFVR